MKRLLVILVIMVAIFATGVVVGAQTFTRDVAPLPAAPQYQPSADELSMAQVYEQAVQSVVNINVVANNSSGTGSGFVIDADGHIVTNNHVIDGARYIEVTFVNGDIAQAELIGRDPDSDLAVIKIDPSKVDLHPISISDSDTAFVGQQVVAIGSPFGEAFTLTSGIVSALDRSIQSTGQFSVPEIIQTDAAINPGNSGGPLINMNGDVIGVNTAILSDQRASSGVGFAIPSNEVRRVVPYLIENGSYAHSWLGISGATIRPEHRIAMNLADDVAGVIVATVDNRGPAAQSGLHPSTQQISTPLAVLAVNGDIIAAINGEPVATMSDLIAYLGSNTLPGDAVTLSVLRDNQRVELNVTLAARP